MPRFLMKRWHGNHVVLTLVYCVILIGLLALNQWAYALIGLGLLLLLAYYLFYAEKVFQSEFTDYVRTLSYRVKKSGGAAIQELPIGMILYDEHQRIEWHNPFISRIVEDDQLLRSEERRVGKEGRARVVHSEEEES